MFTSFRRITSFAVSDLARNKGISLAAIFVLSVAIMLVSGILFFQGTAGYLALQIQNKIDITAYFKEDTSEQDILNVKEEILKMSSGIKGVEYVSKEQALQIFNEKHKDNGVLARALEEVGENPFLPSLNITTTGEPSQYEQVATVLETANFAKFIDKVDFSQKKDTIEKVYSIMSNITGFGLLSGAVLIVVAILVVFNTIKLAIDNSKEEIATMRIVGATDWFVRGPFIVQGIIYGLVSAAICLALSFTFAYFISSKIAVMLPGFDTFSYFLTNLWIFALIQLGFGIGVGFLSSFIVIKRHLES